MKIFNRTLLTAISLFFSLNIAQAELQHVLNNNEKALENATEAKIYFAATVSPKSVRELIQAIDNLNTNYKKLNKIYLYISSYGGDMDSGYTGYWAVKSSHIPIKTVNLSTVMSSATMIFCGANDRQS